MSGSEIRMPKPEIRNLKSDEQRSPRVFRISGFGFPSDFGLRVSDFTADRSHVSYVTKSPLPCRIYQQRFSQTL